MTARIEQTDIDVESWIDGATFTQIKVEIHRNPAMWAQLAPLYDLIDAAQARVDEARAALPADHGPGDEALGDEVSRTASEAALHEAGSPALVRAQADLDELLERAEKLYAEYDADREVWTLRALERDELVAISERLPVPTAPPAPAAAASAAVKARHRARVQAFAEQVAEVKTAIDLEALAMAVVSVEVNGVTMPAPSREGIERLRRRPHGSRHFDELVKALEAITLQEVAIPSPHRTRARAAARDGSSPARRSSVAGPADDLSA